MMGVSSQKNGVALTSIAVKMSMAISMMFMIVLYRESLSILKITGIIFAFLGVFLVTFSNNQNAFYRENKNTKPNLHTLYKVE